MFSFHDSKKCQVLYFNQYIYIVKLKIVETGFHAFCLKNFEFRTFLQNPNFAG